MLELNNTNSYSIIQLVEDDFSKLYEEKSALTGQLEAQRPELVFSVGETLASVEKKMILATLAYCNGSKPEAAKLLGISLKTVYNRLEHYASEASTAANK